MPYIQGEDRNQVTMFPPTLDDYISNDNDVRVIDAFVKGLDMEAMGFIRHTASKDGRPGYDPRDMLRLYIYGYLNKIRSSRKLQTECTRNIELMWLLCKLIPDFRCISDFRKDNAKGIKLVFCEFTKLCDRLQLLGKKSIVIDGSKFKAVNARSKHITKAQAEDRFSEIDKKISEYMNMLDKNDKEETPLEEKSIEEIMDELEALKAKKEKYESYLDEMNSTGETQKSFTDPEAKLMKGNGKFDVSYNTQTAVDSKNHIIADFIVTDHCNDMGLLEEVAKAAKEVMDVDNIDLTADKGYRDSKDIKNCILNGDIPNVNLLDDHEDYTFELKYEENDITEEEKRSKTRSDIEKCLSSGVIPEVLKSKVTIELVDDDIETYEYDADEKIFERNLEDNTVTCPNGEILRKKCKHRGKVRYANKSACKHCKKKCTKAEYKTVDFKDRQKILKSVGKKSNGTTKIRKVIIHFIPDKEKLQQRKCIVEHPFGTVKRWNDGGYLLLKGKIKATAELALEFLGYNLKRAINILGVKEILARI